MRDPLHLEATAARVDDVTEDADTRRSLQFQPWRLRLAALIMAAVSSLWLENEADSTTQDAGAGTTDDVSTSGTGHRAQCAQCFGGDIGSMTRRHILRHCTICVATKNPISY